MTEAISPHEIAAAKQAILPEGVIKCWNDMIAKNYSGHEAYIVQKDIIDALVSTLGVSRQEVFDNHWLDVESIYQARGWKVTYDKPGFSETYEANFTFRAQR